MLYHRRLSVTRFCSKWTALAVICWLWLAGAAVSAAPVTITDCRGTRLQFDHPPEKVISVVPSATEIMFAIGAANKVTGLTYHDATLKEARDKPVIGGFFHPSFDKIKALAPDLVIVSDFHTELIQQLAHEGIQAFVYQMDSVAQSFETIDTFGRLFDRQPEAREIIYTNQQQIHLIEKKMARAVPGEKKTRYPPDGAQSGDDPGQ